MIAQHLEYDAGVTVAAMPVVAAGRQGVRHRGRGRRRADDRPASWRSPPTRRPLPDSPGGVVRVDGHLRVRHRGAHGRAARGRGRRVVAARHRRQPHPDAGRTTGRAGVRLPHQRGARLDGAGRRLLARRRDHRRLLRRAHGPAHRRAAVQPVQRPLADPDATCRRCRRRSSCTTPGTGSAGRSTAWSPTASSSPAGWSASRCCPPACGSTLVPRGALGLLDNVQVGRRAVVQNAIIDKNVSSRRASRSAWTRSTTSRAGSSCRRAASPWSARDRRCPCYGRHCYGEPVTGGPVKVALLTREYPPEVYGGAGVHVEYLARELAPLVDLTVHCQGARPAHRGRAPARPGPAGRGAADVLRRPVHGRRRRRTRTWSTPTPGTPTWPGTWRRCCYGIPHVMTVHSLEPLRPWKAEQLGGGYALSSWAERVALRLRRRGDRGLRRHARRRPVGLPGRSPPERVRVIRNGIDTTEYAPDPGTDVLARHGIDPSRPYVIFVGRITRQKGAAGAAAGGGRARPVRAAGAVRRGGRTPPSSAAEVADLVAGLQASRSGVIWIPEMLPKPDGDPAADPRAGVRLPVGVRAAGHREPGGDGVRDGGRRRPASAASPRSSTTA